MADDLIKGGSKYNDVHI